LPIATVGSEDFDFERPSNYSPNAYLLMRHYSNLRAEFQPFIYQHPNTFFCWWIDRVRLMNWVNWGEVSGTFGVTIECIFRTVMGDKSNNLAPTFKKTT
jgi:hypothetical protein